MAYFVSNQCLANSCVSVNVLFKGIISTYDCFLKINIFAKMMRLWQLCFNRMIHVVRYIVLVFMLIIKKVAPWCARCLACTNVSYVILNCPCIDKCDIIICNYIQERLVVSASYRMSIFLTIMFPWVCHVVSSYIWHCTIACNATEREHDIMLLRDQTGALYFT